MSAPRNKTTSRRQVHQRISAIAMLPVALAAAALATVEASASPWEAAAQQPVQVAQDTWPDEGSGYPGYGDPSPVDTVRTDWPDEGTGFPAYGDQSLPRSIGSSRELDTTSVALGALGGIALGGVGLGITLVVQRRRDHAALPTA